MGKDGLDEKVEVMLHRMGTEDGGLIEGHRGTIVVGRQERRDAWFGRNGRRTIPETLGLFEGRTTGETSFTDANGWRLSAGK